MAKEIPVYLFVGFLESGKTKFIQETFEDPNFDSGDKTLLLICEEGEEEYNPKKFAFPGVTVKVLEDKAELNPQNLLKLEKESGAGRVVIEYNGMWLLQDLADALMRLPLTPPARPEPPPSSGERFRQAIARIRNDLERRAKIEAFLDAVEMENRIPADFYRDAIREANRPSPLRTEREEKFLERVEREWLDD